MSESPNQKPERKDQTTKQSSVLCDSLLDTGQGEANITLVLEGRIAVMCREEEWRVMGQVPKGSC